MSAEDPELSSGRRAGKSEAAFRTISEVSDELEVPQHVLRFWEGRFPQVRPLKRGGGRRYYRPEDVALLRRIRDLLYREGYTIKGVQKVLKDGGAPSSAPVVAAPRPESVPPAPPASVDFDDDVEVEERTEAPSRPLPPKSLPPLTPPSALARSAAVPSPPPPPPAAPAPVVVPSERSDVRGALHEILADLETLRTLLHRR